MTKKRTKRHVPRPLTIPAIIPQARVLDKYPHLATSLYAQIITFCERPGIESSNNLTRQLACIAGGMSHMLRGQAIRGRRDPASIAICSAIACVEGISNRFERLGVIDVTPTEAVTLKAAAGRLDDVLQTMPLHCYERAEKEADFWLREAKMPEAA